MGDRLSSLTSVLGVLVIWHLLSWSGWVSPTLMPGPLRVLSTLYAMTVDGSIFVHIAASLSRVVLGFLCAVGIALPIGMGIGLSRLVFHIVDPWIELVRPIPPIAWVPMAILWLGLDEPPKIAIITYGAFFPIVVNTMTGFQGIDRIHIWAALALGANRRQIFWNVIVRGAMANIVVGLRLGAGMAFIVLVAAELILAYSGLGFLIMEGREIMNTDQIFAGLVVIGILGFLLNTGVVWAESRLVRHRHT